MTYDFEDLEELEISLHDYEIQKTTLQQEFFFNVWFGMG
jgi:hypothetical protein